MSRVSANVSLLAFNNWRFLPYQKQNKLRVSFVVTVPEL